VRLPNLTDQQIGSVGLHATRGEIAVPQLLERLVVNHLEEHAEQLDAALRR